MGVKRTQGKRPTLGFTSEETINLGGGSVVGNDGVTIVIHVQNEVLALSKAEICGENVRDTELIKPTMTAKPMRPMSPLRIDNGGKQGLERPGETQGHTLVET